MAAMQRALLRAGLELKYSEGFNPHPYLSVALPLPVGSSSVCELMDIGMASDVQPGGIREQINAVLPEGIEVLEVYTPERKYSYIAWVEIRGILYYDAGAPAYAAKRLMKRFAEESIVISKKTKRGESDIDIAPFVRDVCFNDDGEVAMAARLSAQNPSITAENLMSALNGGYGMLMPDFYDLSRIEVFDKDMKVFR